LTESIENHVENNLLKTKPKHKYYNYLLIDSGKLFNLIDSLEAKEYKIDQKDVDEFKTTLIYIGKGSNNRKMFHMTDAKYHLEFGMETTKKCDNIIQVWQKGNGIIVLQINSESNHYVALCRENAMIRAAKPNITNIRNGSSYGIMKDSWTQNETLFYGDSLLYYALKTCIIERPTPFFPHHVISKKKSKPTDFIRSNYEYNGILELFLEL
jgi:hypothetical protein